MWKKPLNQTNKNPAGSRSNKQVCGGKTELRSLGSTDGHRSGGDGVRLRCRNGFERRTFLRMKRKRFGNPSVGRLPRRRASEECRGTHLSRCDPLSRSLLICKVKTSRPKIQTFHYRFVLLFCCTFSCGRSRRLPSNRFHNMRVACTSEFQAINIDFRRFDNFYPLFQAEFTTQRGHEEEAKGKC